VANVTQSDSVQLTARIPKRLYQEVKVTCAATGETVQAWMRAAFREYLDRLTVKRGTDARDDGPPSA
jgi:hypothetical protein